MESARESVLKMAVNTRDSAQRTIDRLAVPERANREGDQSLPTTNDLPCIQDLVIADIERRKDVGRRRYGTVLQPFNGRDSLRDAYEEAIDLAVYLRQLLFEHESTGRE